MCDETFSAVLVVAHGDGGPQPEDQAVRALADHLGRSLEIPVTWAVLKRPTTFLEAQETFGDAAGGRILVYPFFMAEGWFVRVRLPNILDQHGLRDVHRLPAFGVDPAVAELLAARLSGLGVAATDPVVLVAHGSASGEPASRLAAGQLESRLRARGYSRTHVGFLEEDPRFDSVLTQTAPAAVVGLFASAGIHAIDDVASAVADLPSPPVHIAALGLEDGAADVVLNAVRDCICARSA